MIHGKYINQGENLTDVLLVRQLSLCEGISGGECDSTSMIDELDPLAVNILVDIPVEEDSFETSIGEAFENGNEASEDALDGPRVNIGCGRILCDVDHFRFYIDQMGIIPQYRHQGYGEFALRMLVDKANICGADKVWLKLPACWNEEAGCSLSSKCRSRAMSFFTKMKFVPAENPDATGEWMVANISDFHNCCHL